MQLAATSTSRNSLKVRSWLSVVRAYQSCERQYAKLLAGFSLTIAQYDVLGAIDSMQGSATPALIAERLLVTKGNISGLLKRLGERGLMVASRNEDDGRSFRCALTPEALHLIALARRAGAEFIEQQLAPFSDQQLARTEQQMNRMREHLEQMQPEAIAAQAKRAPKPTAKRVTR